MDKQTHGLKNPKERLIGLVKWFDSDKGFGVIGIPDNSEYFLHINNFSGTPKDIQQGTPIIFSPRKDRNRNTAENCRIVGELEDWKTLLFYLGKSESVRAEVVVSGRGYRGNPYRGKKIHTFNLADLSVNHIFRGKTTFDIINTITDYFDNDLDSNNFVAYCEFLENRIVKYFSSEISTTILCEIFSYFGQNLTDDILFQVWKNQKFKFVSRPELEEQGIQETILKSHIAEISIPELKRIKDFSFGSEFCSQFVAKEFENIGNFNSDELKNLYQFIEFTTESEQKKLKSQLDNLYVGQIITELTRRASCFATINNSDDFKQYSNLLNLIPREFAETDKDKIKNELNKIIVSKSSNDFLPELWLKGLIDEISFESITNFFLDENTNSSDKITILSKIALNQQFELLKAFSAENNFERAFSLIESLLNKEDYRNYFPISKILFDADIWKEKKCKELAELFVNYIDNHCDDEQKYELFFKGFVKNVPQNLALRNVRELDEEKCTKIFKSQSENKVFIKEILGRKITNDIYTLRWLYELAQEFLDKTDFNSFDKTVFESIEQTEYFKLWEDNKAKIFPENHIVELLADDFKHYSEIEKWTKNKAITQEGITEFLFSYLNQQISVTERKIFYKQFNHIKYLLQTNEVYLEQIKQYQNDFYNVIIWFLDREENFDFELIKRKFIYFAPDEQIRIIRKLFFLKASDKFDLTVEKLNELTRFDLDLYRTNLKFNPEIPVDISTDVVIQALMSYQEKQRFLVESELLSVVLEDLKLDKTMRFKLTHHFEHCLGRETAEFNWERNGEIKKVSFGENKFYYAISFPLMEKWGTNCDRWGNEYDRYEKNPRFEELKEAVKLLPGRKWNSQLEHWGVPSMYEKQVLEFAKEHRFYLDFEGSKYANNTHLAYFKRNIYNKTTKQSEPNIPNGIQFCEGRLANKPHEMFKKDFWWCAGEPCFGKCETIHSTEEWEKYTLLDFCEILGFNTDETSNKGEFISKGIYYQFVGLINRFNRLLKKLYCRDCNQILYPMETSHFAAYTVVRFHCTNENCTNNDEVYLNHCLNGKCNNIIDSRDSQRCDNGLFICDICGSCCSHNMLTRRLTNLESTGGYIHDNLRKCVNEKLGHLERAEYFCHKCKTKMTETSTDVFQCSNCNVKYDTTKYQLKRTHKHLLQKNDKQQ